MNDIIAGDPAPTNPEQRYSFPEAAAVLLSQSALSHRYSATEAVAALRNCEFSGLMLDGRMFVYSSVLTRQDALPRFITCLTEGGAR